MQKPKIGEPCNGCGLCCLSRVCKNGAYALRLVSRLGDDAEGPCPAVIKCADGTYACDIVINPNKYLKDKTYPAKVKSRNFAFLIGSGTGCDEPFPNDSLEEMTKLQELSERLLNDPEFRPKVERAMRIIHGQHK